MTNVTKISFAKGDNAFALELKERVDEYFSTRSRKGNWKLYLKTVILFYVLIENYNLLVLNPAIFWWIKIPLCMLLGLSIAFIGFNIMHDGGHGSYSEFNWINKVMAFTLNLIGGSAYLWNAKHNIAHHTYTNIEGHDEDIDILPFIRTNLSQKKYWFHKYQHHIWYWAFFYSFTYLLWFTVSDGKKYFTGKIGSTEFKKMSLAEHFIFWLSKIFFIGWMVVIPLRHLPFGTWLIGFLITTFTCGLTISIVFQLAHVLPDTMFPDPKRPMQNWQKHQLATTADFATNNKLVSWLTGGLNYQVEHHLFRDISHIHYPAVRKIVVEVCEKFNIKHIEYPTLRDARHAHVFYLKTTGKAA